MRQLIISFLLVSSLLLSFNVTAVNNQLSNTLTLQQAIINVLERSPMIKAVDYESKAAAARIRTAKQTTRFRGSIELENFAGNGLYSGADALETTLSLSKVLELGDKAKLRGDLSENKAMLLRNEQDSKRLDLLAETTKRFIDVVAAQQRLINDNNSIVIAKRTKQVVEERVKAGKLPTVELRRANIKLSRARLKLEHAEHELEIVCLKLAIMWGEVQVSFSTVTANLFAIEQLKSFDSLVLMLERNPDLVRFATEKRLAQSRTLLAKSIGQTDIEIMGGLRHFNATDDTALVVSLNIPFSSASRASSNIKESEMMALRDPLVYEQQYLKLYSTLFELHRKLKHTIDAVSALRKDIIPQAELALKDYEKGYASGRYSFLELTNVQQLLIDLRLEVVNTASDYHQYQIEIDRLTGAGLFAGLSASVPLGTEQ